MYPKREKVRLSRFFDPRHHSQERSAYSRGNCVNFLPSLEFDSKSGEFVSSSKSCEDEIVTSRVVVMRES